MPHDDLEMLAAYFDELAGMTALIASYAAGRLTLPELRAAYGVYFHEAALDGHEGGTAAEFLRAAPDVVRIHQIVQDTLDAIYEGPADISSGASGRTSPELADERLKDALGRCDVSGAVDDARALATRLADSERLDR